MRQLVLILTLLLISVSMFSQDEVYEYNYSIYTKITSGLNWDTTSENTLSITHLSLGFNTKIFEDFLLAFEYSFPLFTAQRAGFYDFNSQGFYGPVPFSFTDSSGSSDDWPFYNESKGDFSLIISYYLLEMNPRPYVALGPLFKILKPSSAVNYYPDFANQFIREDNEWQIDLGAVFTLGMDIFTPLETNNFALGFDFTHKIEDFTRVSANYDQYGKKFFLYNTRFSIALKYCKQ